MSKMKLLGWTEGQWSCVDTLFPLSSGVDSFARAQCEWRQSNVSEPIEIEVTPAVSKAMLYFQYLTKGNDSNISALDAAHNKAVTKPRVNMSSFAGIIL